MTFHRPLVLCLLAVSAPASAIVNGTPPTQARFDREFPWAVALQYPDSDGVCTGEIIAPRWVLTAAHCTSAGVEVRSGQVDRGAAAPARASEVFTHPAYDAKSGRNDVGLIHLQVALASRPVPLMTRAESAALLREGARAVIAGWGRRSASMPFSDRLIVSDVELRSLRREDGRIAYFDPASGPCGGDSGGPMLLARPDGTWVLAGVASRVVGNLCERGGGVGLYVDVTAVLDFIEGHVRDGAR
jgi:secreted trypsin-like serine protease